MEVLAALRLVIGQHWVASFVFGLFLCAVVVVGVSVALSLRSPPPDTGTPATLPNGMNITQWTKLETDFLYKEIFSDETEYGRDGLSFKPGAVIIDAGANIGMFTLYSAMRCKGVATIIAFEPMPTTYAVLAANAAAAVRGQYDAQFGSPPGGGKLRIETVPFGLSDSAAEVTFEHHPHMSIWSTSDSELAEARLVRMEDDVPRALANNASLLARLIPAWLSRCITRTALSKIGKTVRVQARLKPLSDFITSLGLTQIDLLKVDVEGAEMAVLRGVKEAHWPMIQQVVAEAENFADAAEMEFFLQQHGFATTARATERERTPGVHSEVSMITAWRPGYGPVRVKTEGDGKVMLQARSASKAGSKSSIASNTSASAWGGEDSSEHVKFVAAAGSARKRARSKTPSRRKSRSRSKQRAVA